MSDPAEPNKPKTPYNYPGNAKKQQKPDGTPDRKIVPIVSEGENVSQRKKPLGKRIMESFTGDDSRTVGNYVFFDVILPAMKSLMVEAGNSFLERLILGSDARPGGARRGYTNYGRYSQGVASRTTPAVRANPRAVHDFDDIILDNRGTAEEVIDALDEIIKNYDNATVGNLYELVGITGSYTDDKYGWTSMVGARVERVRDGYVLRLPRTEALD